MNKNFTKSAVATSVLAAVVGAGLTAQAGVASAATLETEYVVKAGTLYGETSPGKYPMTAIGSNSKAYGFSATALGTSTVSGSRTLKEGKTAETATADDYTYTSYTLAVGNEAQATDTGAIAIGSATKSTYKNAIVIGRDAETKTNEEGVSGEQAIVIGYKAYTRSDDAIVLGYNTSTGTGASEAVVIGRESYVHSADSVLVGAHSGVAKTAATGVTLGSYAYVLGGADNSVALGYGSRATEANTVSVGGYNAVTKQNVTRKITNVTAGVNDTDAVNVAQLTSQINSVKNKYAVDGTANAGGVAIGPKTEAYADRNAAAIGQNAYAYGQDSFAIGSNVTAGKNTSTEEGGHAYDNGNYSWSGAIGTKLTAEGKGSIVIGLNSSTAGTATDSLVIGRDATAKDGALNSIVIGLASTATAKNAFAIGRQTSSTAENGIAFGVLSTVTDKGTNGTALGGSSHVYDANGTAVGYNSIVAVNATNATALGNTAQVYGDASTAVGYNAHTNSGSKNSIALGANSLASSGEGSMALGNNAVAYHSGSVALGYKSVTTQVNEVSVGGNGVTRKITNVTAGTADTDAVNVSQLKAYVAEHAGGGQTGITGVDTDTHIEAGTYEVTNGQVTMKILDKDGTETGQSVTITGIGTGTGSSTTVTGGDGITASTGSDGSVTVGLDSDAKAAVDNAKNLGSLDGVNAGIKGDTIVDSVNNLDSKVGDLSKLNADVKGGSSVVDAINKADAKIDSKVGDQKYTSVKATEVKDDMSATEAIGALNNKIASAGSSAAAAQKTADEAKTAAAAAQTTADTAVKNAAAAQSTADAAAAEAKKHNTVSAGNDNIKVDGTTKNANGGTEYKVSLADDIKVKSVTADTVTATSGTIGGVAMKDGAVTATSATIGGVSVKDGSITTGDTVISSTGVKVGNSELTTDSLKVNGKDYITADGINANGQAISNLKAGDITSASSTDAVTGGQLYETNQQVQANSDSIANLWKKTGDLNKKINRTGANAAALAALHPLDFDENHKVSASAGIGQYHGTGALAVGVFIRPTENLMFNLGGSFASSDRMFNSGVSYRFGDNGVKPVATNAQMADRVNTLTAENRDLTAQLKASNTKLESVASENAELRAEIQAIKAKLGMK